MAVRVHFAEERAWYQQLMPAMPTGGTLWFYGKKAHHVDKFLLEQILAKRYSGAHSVIFTARVPKQKRYACVTIDDDDATLAEVVSRLAKPENAEYFATTFNKLIYTLVFNHESLNTSGLHFAHNAMDANSLRVKLLNYTEMLQPNQYPDVATTFKVSFDNLQNAEIDRSNSHADFRALGMSLCGVLANSLEVPVAKASTEYRLFNLASFDLETSAAEHALYKLPPVVSSLLTVMANLAPGKIAEVLKHYLKTVLPKHMIDRCVSQFGATIMDEIVMYALTWEPALEFRGQPLTSIEHGFLFSIVNHARLAAYVTGNVHALGVEYIVSAIASNFGHRLIDGFNVTTLVTSIFSESPYAFSNVYDAFKVNFARVGEVADAPVALDYKMR